MNGASSVKTPPTASTGQTRPSKPLSRSRISSIVVSKFLSLLALAPIEGLGITRRALGRSVEPSHAGCNAVTEPEEHQPGGRVKAAIQKLTAEKAQEHAQHELDAYGAVTACAFPVLLHRVPRIGAHLARPLG